MTDINVNALAEAINNKADRNILNLTTAGYTKGSSLGMPSSQYVNLTLGASGTTYTAPANGYLLFRKKANGSSQYMEVQVDGAKYTVVNYAPISTGGVSMLVPILRGKSYVVNYTLTGDTTAFRFIYADGDQFS